MQVHTDCGDHTLPSSSTVHRDLVSTDEHNVIQYQVLNTPSQIDPHSVLGGVRVRRPVHTQQVQRPMSGTD